MGVIDLSKHWTLSGGRDGGEAGCYEYQVWDVRGRLVYVGIADDFRARWAQHQRRSWWMGEVEVAYVDVTAWPTRTAARWSEAAVINEQSPVYNIALEEASYRAAQESEWPAPIERFIYKPKGVAA